MHGELARGSAAARAACSSGFASAAAGASRLTDADYAEFLSPSSRERRPSAIRALMPLLKLPGMISLGGGMPNPSTFPFSKVSVELVDGRSYALEGDRLAEGLQYR